MLYGRGAVPSHGHTVSFHDGDADAATVVACYVAEGFVLGEPVVVVLTAEHRRPLEAALEELGWDLASLRAAGRFRILDAEETLALFMVDGVLDADAFRTQVAPLIDEVRGDSPRVRIFGEMVAVLWHAGNVAAALELESFWNDLARERSFTLLCSYPHSVLDQDSLADVGRVCALHSDVLPPSSYHTTGPAGDPAQPDEASWAFLPVPRAIPALRRFVSGTLRSWGEELLVTDVELVTSEMATNAITHAGSPFHASLVRSAGVIRIAIVDSGPGAAAQRIAAQEDVSGRGISIVEALADRWGHGDLPGGKVVWAEFRAAPDRQQSA